MTEHEAKKILDFLTRRFKRRTNILIDSFKKECTYNHFLLKDNLIVKTGNGLYYVWKNYNNLKLHEKTVQIDGEMAATKIVSCLFNHAKTCELVVCGNIFVFKGETIEEIKVKADLEDFVQKV